ncbi:hypothetical protein LNP05_29520 [Klebsiella pneumoniae subsp. pneumoniae]|nr:hypothetical protein [Klebsiella pneumoniae subsp. pneumoniae]
MNTLEATRHQTQTLTAPASASGVVFAAIAGRADTATEIVPETYGFRRKQMIAREVCAIVWRLQLAAIIADVNTRCR